MQLWPCWALGVFMVYQTWKSEHRDVLKIDWKALMKFLKFMGIITAIRFVMMKFLLPEAAIEQARSLVAFLPWQTTLGVFWEDAVYTMPLVLMERVYGNEKWHKWMKYPMVGLAMVSFGVGHVYQGALIAALLSLYIPWSMGMARKYGYGTVMLGHMSYDLITLLSLKIILGA